jgi:hypothetical protein
MVHGEKVIAGLVTKVHAPAGGLGMESTIEWVIAVAVNG